MESGDLTLQIGRPQTFRHRMVSKKLPQAARGR